VPFEGYEHLLAGVTRRRWTASCAQQEEGAQRHPGQRAGRGLSRAGLPDPGDQVRRSVRSVRGNQWMFRTGHPADQPLRIRPELLRGPRMARSPSCANSTPVRMDLTHSARGATSSSSAWITPRARGAERLGRSRRARPRCRAAAAHRGVAARDRPARAAPDLSVDLGAQADITTWPRCSTSPATTWACSRRP
jgi:hypothetical protein